MGPVSFWATETKQSFQTYTFIIYTLNCTKPLHNDRRTQQRGTAISSPLQKKPTFLFIHFGLAGVQTPYLFSDTIIKDLPLKINNHLIHAK
jgi:hypothetical protein